MTTVKRKKPVSKAAWESVAEDVLSVLLVEEGATEAARHYHVALDEGLKVEHFPQGKHRQLMQAIADLREQKSALTWHAIEAVTVGVTLADHTRLVTLADDTRMGAVFRDNVKLLIDYGLTLSMAEQMDAARQALLAGKDRDGVVDHLVDEVTRKGVVRIIGETAEDAGKAFKTLMDETPKPLVSTGLAWVDEAVGGFGENELWYIAGPYKSSKTRLAYNMALHAARRGVSVGILSLENLQREINAQFVSMLAIEWLLAQNKVAYDANSSLYWISPKMLLRVRSGYRQWPDLKARAVDHGIEAFRQLQKHIRIYDRSESLGELSTVSSIKRVIKRDKRLYGGRLYFVDHQGLVDARGSVYEQTSATSKAFQSLSRAFPDDPITLVVLAQLNEETIKAEGEGYSAGVKGGGDSPANSDVMLTTKPVPIKGAEGEFHNDRTTLRVKYSRWGSGGHKELVGFHPESGLIRSLEVPALAADGIEW